MDATGEIAALLSDASVGPAVVGVGLAATRIYATVRTVPFLGGRDVPATLHVALALGLAVSIGPLVDLGPVPPAPMLAVLVAKEALVGFTVGYLASLPFRMLEQAGVLGDVSRASSLAQSAGIMSDRAGSSPSGNLLMLGTMVVFFETPAHGAFWSGLGATFDAVPVGPPGPAQVLPMAWEPILQAAIWSSAGLLGAAFLIALPVMLAVLVTDLVAGAVSRFVPSAGGTFTFMPLRAAVGLAALALAMTILSPVIAQVLLEAMSALGAIGQ